MVTNRHFHNTPGFKASNAITGNLIKAVMEQAVKGSTGKTINRHRRGAWRRRKEEGGWGGGGGGIGKEREKPGKSLREVQRLPTCQDSKQNPNSNE